MSYICELAYKYRICVFVIEFVKVHTVGPGFAINSVNGWIASILGIYCIFNYLAQIQDLFRSNTK